MSHVVVWYTLVVFTMSATGETLYTEGPALSNHSCRPADCVDLQCFNVVFENCGPLRVYPDDGAYVRVSCEVDPGGGWTVMQVIIRYIQFTPPLYSDLLSLDNNFHLQWYIFYNRGYTNSLHPSITTCLQSVSLLLCLRIVYVTRHNHFNLPLQLSENLSDRHTIYTFLVSFLFLLSFPIM